MGLVRTLALVTWLAGCSAQIYGDGMPMPGSGPGPSGPADDPNAGGSGSGGASSSLTPAEYITQLAMTQCGQLFQCRPTFPGPPEDFATYYGDMQSDCQALALDALEPAVLEGEVDKQRIVFDGAAAASCITGFGQPECTTFWTHDWLWAEPCYHVFSGTVPDGGACVIDFDCATPGSGCDPSFRRCAPIPPGA